MLPESLIWGSMDKKHGEIIAMVLGVVAMSFWQGSTEL